MEICYGGFIGFIVSASMTLMKSGWLSNFFPDAGFEPVGGGRADGVFCQHAGQMLANEYLGWRFLGVPLF